MQELPLTVTFSGQNFLANRSSYRRDNNLIDGGFMNSAQMTITAVYSKITQSISLGDTVEIAGRKFRIVSADLSQDAVSVDFQLEDINR